MKKKLISLFVSLTIMSTIMPIIPVSASAIIQLGDYIQMGEYYDGPILWRCVAFEKISGYDDDGNPIIDSTDSVTEYKSGYLPLMLSDKILCIKPFDASGTDLSGSHGRGYVENGISGYWRQNSYGSNYWGDSNIRCWLNSDCTSGNVLYTCGNIPNSEKLEENAYADEAGFLHDFTNTEKELVEKVSQKSILDGFEYSQDINNNYHRWGSSITDCVQNYSTSFSEYITDKMFLLDVKQINTVYNNRDVLGNDYYIGKPTQNCIDNTEYENEDLSIEKGWYNWLRTPDAHLYYPHRGSRNVRGIHIGGEISNAAANNPSFGIRPAFFLNPQTANFVSGSGTENNPYIIDNAVRVHTTDTSNIANSIESDLNSLLSSVTLCDTTIKGPTFDVEGHTICPLEFGAKAVLDFSGLSKSITIDEKNKKVHVILGKLNNDGSASVVQTTDMCDASWSKQYNEIKDLYKSMTGLNPNGSDKNGVSNWNKFEKLKGELNRMECDLFVKASMECVAYLDFDYQTGYLTLSEGGFIETASLGVDFRYPLIGNCLYATLGLTGSETGTVKAMVTSSGTLNPQMSIKPSITAKASITGEIPLLCKAEGGIDATLAVLLQTFDPNLTVMMSGNIFLNAQALNKTLIDWSKPYLNVQLYPEFQALSLMSFGDYRDIYDNATSVPRDYLNTISLFSLGAENAIYEQNGVYPDNDAQLVKLPGNAMMLVWTGDDGTKSDINRTSLMYSIYSDGVWSEVQKIAEDGTATGYFKAVSDGTTAYIVYQKLSQVLDDDTSVEDMLADTDLYMVKYENGAFDETTCLNDYDNTSYEFIGDVNLAGDNLTIGWIENSENDVFLSEGTTSIKIRSVENDTLSDVSEITALSAAEGQYPGDIHITDDTIYYAVYDASGEETTADLYTYSKGASTNLIDADRIYNIKNIDGTLYYIKNSSIYKFENATETAVGFDNVTSFEIASNGDNYSMLMSICDGARNEIYISNLSNGEWSQAEHFTDLGKYIRSYSPFMYSDGSINLAVSVAEVNDNIEEGESVYGNTSIMVLNQCDYCDISTSYVYYEEDEIQPDGDMNLCFDVNNDSANALSSIKVALTDENENLLDEQTVECEIAPFSTEKLNIKYHLPQNISKTQLNLTVSIDGEEKDYLNNTVTTEFGYTNLSVSPIDCTVNKNNTADIKSTISNVGFTNAENVVVKVYNGSINGNVLDEINIGTMEVGETYDLEYTFPEELMVSPDEDVMNAVYVQAETSSIEALYSDNDQKVAFDSFVKSDSSVLLTPIANTLAYTGEPQELITAGTADGGTMQYSLDGENYSADIPTAVNASEYTVYYKVVGDEGYNDTLPETIDVTIEPSKEDTPCIKIDFENEMLTQFDNGSYTIDDVSIVPTENNIAIDNYIGKTISIIKKASDANHVDSEPQLLEIPVRPSAPSEDMFTVTQPQIIGGTGTIEGISTDMEYSADNGMTWTDSNGSDITEITGGTKYLIRVKSTDNSFKSDSYSVTITAFVADSEQTPNIGINYADETLTGFDNGNYTINGAEVTVTDGKVNISPEWIGTTISMVKKGTATTTDSNAQSLDIPARPSAPNVTASSVTAGGRNDGKIVGVTTDMEYKLSDSEIWLDCTDIEITGLVAGTYDVRVKSSGSCFSGIIANVEVDTECVKIIAEYTTDGILEDIKLDKINISEITASQNTTTNKVFYWETLENMKPITLKERY